MQDHWKNRAYGLLSASLTPPRHELNELDWKLDLSAKGDRVAEHLCAMANHPGGGYLAFGVDDQGVAIGVDQSQVKSIIARLSSVARDGVEPPLTLDHTVERFEDRALLLIRVIESPTKPVHLRGKGMEHAFIRSGGTTRKASRQDLGNLLLHSRTPRWEELNSSVLINGQDVLSQLDLPPILELLDRPAPTAIDEILSWARGEGFVTGHGSGEYYITHLGAVASAKDITDFPEISRKAVRLIVYNGRDKSEIKLQREGKKGYAIGFKGLLEFLVAQLPQSEVIEKALRVRRTVYPELALRELIANALIHQDFTVSGAGPIIEVFDDRLVISNPGGLLPSKQLNRLIGTQPESRNERLAGAFRRYKICEELGSGLLKAGKQAEVWGLPPIKFESNNNSFSVTLFAPRSYAEMTQSERLDACYQHCVLRYYSSEKMTNKSLRERLRMPDKQRPMVSALLQQALEQDLIRTADPENRSRKYTEYLPFWA